MGNLFQKAWQRFVGTEDVRILMLGLDAAGKTTILYKLKLGEVVNTIPTIGFNVESFEYKNISFNAWDIGGQWRLRSLWQHYFDGAQCLIYVVDSADRDRIDENAEQLKKLMDDEELKDCSLMIYANKQDVPGAMTCPELTEKLGLCQLRRPWYIQATCATRGDGLYEGLDWVSKHYAKTQKKA